MISRNIPLLDMGKIVKVVKVRMKNSDIRDKMKTVIRADSITNHGLMIKLTPNEFGFVQLVGQDILFYQGLHIQEQALAMFLDDFSNLESEVIIRLVDMTEVYNNINKDSNDWVYEYNKKLIPIDVSIKGEEIINSVKEERPIDMTVNLNESLDKIRKISGLGVKILHLLCVRFVTLLLWQNYLCRY